MTAMARPRVLVVAPAFNEEASVGAVVTRVRAAVPEASILVVDDGSDDETAAVARAAGAQVLTLPYNLGVGGAMRVGYRFAARSNYDVVVQIDADGQHAPEDVPTLLAALDHADIVVGSRFAGQVEYHVGRVRRLVMRWLARRLSRVTGASLTDVTSGFRAIGPRAIAVFARIYPAEYLGDTVEALVIAAKSGLRVAEVGVRMHPRAGGRPSQTLVKGVVYVFRAVAMIALARYQQWPTAVAKPMPSSSATRPARITAGGVDDKEPT